MVSLDILLCGEVLKVSIAKACFHRHHLAISVRGLFKILLTDLGNEVAVGFFEHLFSFFTELIIFIFICLDFDLRRVLSNYLGVIRVMDPLVLRGFSF